MGVRGGVFSGVHAFESQAVAGKGVGGLCGDDHLEGLAARFLLGLVCHLPYYTGQGVAGKVQAGCEAAMKSTNSGRVRRSGEEALKGKPHRGKPVSVSCSEMTEMVLPSETNPLGKLLGGHIMHLVDIVAAMAAHRHSNSLVVTVSVDYLDFRNPVSVGEIVILESRVNRAFRTSMEVGVEVHSENYLTGKRTHTTSAYVTFVAIDEHTGKPKEVPPLILKTAAERGRFRAAGERRKIRLAHRYGKGQEE